MAGAFLCDSKSIFRLKKKCQGESTVIVGTIHGRQGYSPGLAQGLCRPPEPRCPRWLSLHRHHVGQSLQGGGDVQVVTPLAADRQTLLVAGTGCWVVPLERCHSC